jgi:cobalamin synthase
MSTAWRPLLSALGSMKRVPVRYMPVAGMLVGFIGGACYWVAEKFWPSSVTVGLFSF